MTLLSPIWLLVAGLLLAAGWFARKQFVQDGWHQVIATGMLNLLRPRTRLTRSLLPAFLLAAGIALALSGPASPTTGDKEAFAHAESWLVIVDVSESMNHGDIAPTRLGATQRLLQPLLAAAGARPLGLIIFSGDAFLAHPPTFDRQSFTDFAQALDSSLIELNGSRPDRALALAQTVIGESELHHARIWMLTDGGGLDSLSQQIAQQLGQRGHRLDILLIAREGSQDPEPVDADTALKVAEAGDGKLWQVDALGRPLKNPFSANELFAEQQALQLELGGWQLWSQWIILLLLPLALLLICRGES